MVNTRPQIIARSSNPLFIIGKKDPGCGGNRGGRLPTIDEAEAAGFSNCGWMYDDLIQAINNQPNI